MTSFICLADAVVALFFSCFYPLCLLVGGVKLLSIAHLGYVQ